MKRQLIAWEKMFASHLSDVSVSLQNIQEILKPQ